jgi:hypothetical protein
MSYTYDAFGGETHYTKTMPDGHVEHGPNQPDQTIAGYLSHAQRPSDMVAFLQRYNLTSVMVVRAFNACGFPGVATVLGAVSAYPEVAAWYATQEPVAEADWHIPPPSPTVSLDAQGDALVEAVRSFVAAVRNR